MTDPILQSEHVDTFNHDPWAADYDDDVQYNDRNDNHMIETFDEEFFWYVDHATTA